MSQWPDVIEEGYKPVENKNKPESDLWKSAPGTDIKACKAVCNSNSGCRAIAYKKDTGECLLKTVSESDGNSPDTAFDMYYKQGEPANEKRLYLTKPFIPGKVSGTSSWRDNGIYPADDGTCDAGAFRVGRAGGARSCTWIPKATEMCPKIGDLVYFRHNIEPWINNTDSTFQSNVQSQSSGWALKWNVDPASLDPNYGWGQNFDDVGSNAQYHSDRENVVCGYNRIDPSKWGNETMDLFFTFDEKKRYIRDHCFGPGITAKELDDSTGVCFKTLTANSSSDPTKNISNIEEINEQIMTKLKNEQNWWSDSGNCVMFAGKVKQNFANNKLISKAIEVVNDLPTSVSWSNHLIRSLNEITNNDNVPTLMKQAITNKTKAYCDARPNKGTTDEACGCKNAVEGTKPGGTECTSNIKGCEDVSDWVKVMKDLQAVGFGDSLVAVFGNYNATSRATACVASRSGDKILSYTQLDKSADNILQVCNIITQATDQAKIEITGNVKNICNQAATTGTGTGTGTGDGVGSGDGDGAGGEDTTESGGKGYIILIILILLSLVFTGVTVGLLLF
jgi:hypothetical protein